MKLPKGGSDQEMLINLS